MLAHGQCRILFHPGIIAHLCVAKTCLPNFGREKPCCRRFAVLTAIFSQQDWSGLRIILICILISSTAQPAMPLLLRKLCCMPSAGFAGSTAGLAEAGHVPTGGRLSGQTTPQAPGPGGPKEPKPNRPGLLSCGGNMRLWPNPQCHQGERFSTLQQPNRCNMNVCSTGEARAKVQHVLSCS